MRSISPSLTNIRFLLSAIATVLAALIVGYFNVGAFYLIGLPFVPLIISIVFLWRTNISVWKRILATLLGVLALFAGFLMFVWINDISVSMPEDIHRDQNKIGPQAKVKELQNEDRTFPTSRQRRIKRPKMKKLLIDTKVTITTYGLHKNACCTDRSLN